MNPVALHERRAPASSAPPDVKELTDKSWVKVSEELGVGAGGHTGTKRTLFSGFLLPEGSRSASLASLPPRCLADR